MAEVILASASEKQVWTNKFLLEYVRESSLLPYMGTSPSSIIRIRNELSEGGKYLNIPLITRLRGRGVRGAEVLKGNEDDLGNFNDQVQVDWIRNAVKVPKSTQYKTEINLLDAARPQLSTWDAELLRDDTLDAFASIIIPGAADTNGIAGTDSAVLYDAATAGQRNTFLVNNTDRILFGKLKSNSSSGVWQTALATIDNTDDKLSAAVITLAKRMAKTAGQAAGSINIRPFKSDMTAGREWYVLFANSMAFRDLSLDSTIIAANTYARAREGDGMERNPLFQDGDLIYNGVIIREMPEIPTFSNGTIMVGMNFLCGQSAIAVAYGQDPTFRIDLKEDYEFRPGVAIEELRGLKKVSYAGKQYGVVTIVTAAVADV